MKYVISLICFFMLACLGGAGLSALDMPLPTSAVPSAPSLSVATLSTRGVGYEVCAEGLHVRAGPGVGWSVIRFLGRGDFVSVYEWRDGWAKISENEWVRGKYLCKEEDD